MIDEKKLIEEIKYLLFNSEMLSPRWFAINEMLEIIKRQPKVGEWIPCSERLPEEDGIYIIDDREFNSPWVHTAGFKISSKSWNDIYERYEDGTVIAWQPLPEPWEGE